MEADDSYQNLAGTAENARIHAKALDILIKSRGGLQRLGADGMPRCIVSWLVLHSFVKDEKG